MTTELRERRDGHIGAQCPCRHILPVRSEALAGILCSYVLVHLDAGQRAGAYAQFARVLHPAVMR